MVSFRCISAKIDLALFDELPAEWHGEVMEFLAGERKGFSRVPEIAGTEFQRAVLGVMAQIPYGGVKSYGEVAELAGYPRAARAVGTVCRHNKYPVVIPCHRVVASNGIGGYGYALETKRELLRMEGHSF